MGVPQTEQFSWTDEAVARARQLWSDGDSASQIACALTTLASGPSRNAVIGKLHRMGLRRGDERAAKTIKAKAARSRSLLRPRPLTQVVLSVRRPEHGGPTLIPVELPPPEPELQAFNDAIPAEQRCSLVDLDELKCHYPVGEPSEPGFFFCGGITKEIITRSEFGPRDCRSPYCAFHHRITHQGSAPNLSESERERRRNWGKQLAAKRTGEAA